MLSLGYFVLPWVFTQSGITDYSDSRYTTEIINQSPLYFSFLGNWSAAFNGYSKFKFIAHFWTISVEEQFYLPWPLLLPFMTNKRRTTLILILLFMIPGITRSVLFGYNVEHPGVYVNTFARVDTLALGAVISMIYLGIKNSNNSLLVKEIEKHKWLLSTPIQLLVVSMLVFYLYQYNVLSPGPAILNATGFMLQNLLISYFLIISLFNNTMFARLMSHHALTFLGKISYGLYVYHVLAKELSMPLLRYVPDYCIPVVAFLLTVALASISYYLFERRFLRVKERYSTVLTKPV